MQASQFRAVSLAVLSASGGCRVGYERVPTVDAVPDAGGLDGRAGASSNGGRAGGSAGTRAASQGGTAPTGMSGEGGSVARGGDGNNPRTSIAGSAGAVSGGGAGGTGGSDSSTSVGGVGGGSSSCRCAIGQGCVGSACVSGKIAFVTSQVVSSDFGGVAGADQLCADSAVFASLPGQYLAWISDSRTSPATRFTRSTLPYVLVNAVVVADDWADLSDGQLAAPIDVDELGNPAVAMEVWTGTRADGTQSADTCDNWTSTSASSFGEQGVTSLANAGWTEVYVQFCDRASIRLLCFQQ